MGVRLILLSSLAQHSSSCAHAELGLAAEVAVDMALVLYCSQDSIRVLLELHPHIGKS